MQSLPHLLVFPTTSFSHTQAPHPGKYFPTTPEDFSALTCKEFSHLCVYTVILSCFAVIAPMIHSP